MSRILSSPACPEPRTARLFSSQNICLVFIRLQMPPPATPFFAHPYKCPGGVYLPSNDSHSVSPLFATHANRSQFAKNTTALSPLLATHTDSSAVSPVFATHTKTTGVYSNNSHYETPSSSSPRSVGLSFHALTNRPFSIPFVLILMHRMGRGGSDGSRIVIHLFAPPVTCPHDVHPPYYWSQPFTPTNWLPATIPSFLLCGRV